MPLIRMKEIFTPLKLIGIKLFKAADGQLYIKWEADTAGIFFDIPVYGKIVFRQATRQPILL